MADLYLDHNVSLHLVSPLTTAGHNVVAARDLGHALLTDDAQLIEAIKLGRILVTHNKKDFVLLYDAWISWTRAFDLTLPKLPRVLILEAAPLPTLSNAVIDLFRNNQPEDLRSQLLWRHGRMGWQRRIAGGGWGPFPSVEFRPLAVGEPDK